MAGPLRPLYLDYNATTPLDPRVFETMKPWFLDDYGNAGSRSHVYGVNARQAVEEARKQVADLIHVSADELTFTSGATESNNLAILGLAEYGNDTGRKHILSTNIEHKSVLEPLDRLRASGFEVELLPVIEGGYVEPSEVKRRLRRDTLMVSVMHSNNETGILQPISEVSEILMDSQAIFHIDAAQTYGKEVDALAAVECDLLSISAHKVYGPKGIGALYTKRAVVAKHAIGPLSFGGGQERGLRPGTLPVPLIVGLGEAARLAGQEYLERQSAAGRIKDRILRALHRVDHHINGDQAKCQSHVLNVSFPGIDSEALMMAARGVMAISNGSACTSTDYAPSHVLTAMGVDEATIESSVRISWGQGITSLPTDELLDLLNALRM